MIMTTNAPIKTTRHGREQKAKPFHPEAILSILTFVIIALLLLSMN
jgi:hypothetical protein